MKYETDEVRKRGKPSQSDLGLSYKAHAPSADWQSYRYYCDVRTQPTYQ